MTWIYNDNGFVLLQCQVHEVSGQDMSSIQGCLSLFTISGVACMVKLGWCESKGMKLNLENITKCIEILSKRPEKIFMQLPYIDYDVKQNMWQMFLHSSLSLDSTLLQAVLRREFIFWFSGAPLQDFQWQ